MKTTSMLGQMFMIGISGHTLTSEEKDFIIQNDIGGVILFSRNVSTPEQILKLTTEIQELSQHTESQLPLLISIDMEGGRVARLKEPFTIWPPMRYLGDQSSPQLAFEVGQALGAELLAVGINMDFAPCIDVFLNPKNEVIGDRAFSDDPEEVAKIASGIIRGFKKVGMVSCVKHFPGHGYTSVDSHFDLPVDPRTWNELLESEIIPYKKCFRSKAEFLMTAHILFENIDAQYPVTLSEKFLKQHLREELNYPGLVITDDLDMKALSKNASAEDLTFKALQAGANMFLFCNNPESHTLAVEAMMDRVGQFDEAHLNHIKESFDLILEVKDNLPTETPSLEIIGCEKHKELVQKIKV
ncbi:MAG: beta-N-acetylhexosaminidase [Bdellovibrionaceae bacterium]|nr:beta-N-acetylhexosaminidase [Pseudobdellovibrionaceae bacterium]